jgi:hypothetical protein
MAKSLRMMVNDWNLVPVDAATTVSPRLADAVPVERSSA